jgi:hypothetical protein
MNRVNRREITFRRVLDALESRIKNFPHRISWNRWSKDYLRNCARLESYRDIYKGERCFIIGNGPSLKRMDLAPLKNETTFGMNRIYLLFNQMGFETNYFVSINKLVLDQFAAEIARLEMPKFLNWNQRSLFESGESETIYLHFSLALKDKFVMDLCQPIYSGGTVTFAALQLAYWMGFSQVVLIGIDHNFVEKGTPNQTEIRREERDASHFSPDYFPKGVRWQLPDLLRSELSYRLAKDAFENDGREVVDATIGGRLEVFRKVDYGQLFGK